ncbi:MAG: hypothetical protein NC833_05975, partial [Candidatus Omnitrophica bacterium]|nr:hypothetical protein [Candidatus Omnitrophota bacterium]
MRDLVSIYNKVYDDLYSEGKEEKQYKKITLYREKELFGDIYLPFKFSSILIILPGAGYREKSKELIFKQFKYLIKEKIGLCIVNF